MLYLPPGWGHDGVALDACFTYSVGFRAPRGAELAASFLDYLHERGLPDADYRDPDLRPPARPARIGPENGGVRRGATRAHPLDARRRGGVSRPLPDHAEAEYCLSPFI